MPSKESAEQRRDSIIELTKAGCSTRHIARVLKCSERHVHRIRSQQGCLVAAPAIPMSAQEMARAEEMFDDGCSIAEVARTLGRATSTIRHRFPGRGWTLHQVAEYTSTLRLRVALMKTADVVEVVHRRGVYGSRRYSQEVA